MTEVSATRPVDGLVVPISEIRIGVIPAKPQPGPWKRWLLREPLVHFLLIGAVLFAGYTWLTPSSTEASSNRIEFTADDVKQLQVTWMAQWQRLPTPDELQGLIETRIRQEVLYREALTMGLDQNDEIIKRRLAQKMEFLAEDISGIGTPSSEELKAWFEKNSARFALPGRLTFRHIYFSPDKRSNRARPDAETALKMLSAKPAAESEPVTGDRFVDQNSFADSSLEQVIRVFGTKFSESLFKLTSAGSWQGPLESGLGWHLVWIETISPGRIPSFEEVDPEQLKMEWTTEQREATKRKAFADVRQRYEIVIPK
jgi:peptidyl-prolyl cis-trans isomerase C